MKYQSKSSSKFILEKFLSYGLHVGGLKFFWKPEIKPYLLAFRQNFCIFDLNLTLIFLRRALKFLSKTILKGKTIVFIGGPKGVEKEFSLLCKRHGHLHIDPWVDGSFTNKENSFSFPSQPALFFIFDLSFHEGSIKEILSLDIPIMAFVNSSDHIRNIDYPIPANINSWKGGLFSYNLFRYLFLEDLVKFSKK